MTNEQIYSNFIDLIQMITTYDEAIDFIIKRENFDGWFYRKYIGSDGWLRDDINEDELDRDIFLTLAGLDFEEIYAEGGVAGLACYAKLARDKMGFI